MKRIVLLLSVTALLFSFQDIHSQSLRSRVKKAIFKEEPVEVKDDSTTVVEIEDAGESSSINFSNDIMMDALGLTGNVDYETDYSFDAYIQMEITNYKKRNVRIAPCEDAPQHKTFKPAHRAKTRKLESGKMRKSAKGGKKKPKTRARIDAGNGKKSSI